MIQQARVKHDQDKIRNDNSTNQFNQSTQVKTRQFNSKQEYFGYQNNYEQSNQEINKLKHDSIQAKRKIKKKKDEKWLN